MKLLLDANGNVVVRNEKPVYVIDGKEVEFDYPGTMNNIAKLNAEAKSHRERAEAAEGKLKTFEGIEDPAAARKAIELVKNLDDKKLIDAGEVQRVKDETTRVFQERLTEAEKRAKGLEDQLYNEKIGGSFARSKYIGDKLAIPADLAQARFGSNFKVEDGAIVAYDAHGQKIYSKARAGELANFEEAIEVLIDTYPGKDHILKSSGSSGSGGGGGGGRNTGGKQDLSGLSPTQRMTAAREQAGK